MKKRSAVILLLVFVLMITGCGNSNSTEEPDRADGKVTENETGELSIIEVTEVIAEKTSVTEEDIFLSSFTEEQIEEAKKAALTYYEGTVFTVNSIEYFNGDLLYGDGEDCCNFTVNVSKDGVIQEPDRTISLKLDNGIWEVVNEGY